MHRINKVAFRVTLAKNDISQAKLARRIGISANSLSRKVIGQCDFTLNEVIKICTVLGVADPREIFMPELQKKSQVL